MDELLKTLITGAPNLFVAIWVIWYDKRLIDRFLAQQDKLIDRLLVLLPDPEADSQTDDKP